MHCAQCKVKTCSKGGPNAPLPAGCLTTTEAETLREAKARYEDPVVRRLYLAAARTEARGYAEWPRVREVVEFAKLNGYRRLGLAFCVGLSREAEVATEIFTAHGFEVYSACCGVGRNSKDELGIPDEDKLRPGNYESGCNPVGQAALLERFGTELNVVMGLCVGHDSLFFMHSKAPTTVLVAKDRVTGHNPVAALTYAHGYFKKRVFPSRPRP